MSQIDLLIITFLTAMSLAFWLARSIIPALIYNPTDKHLWLTVLFGGLCLVLLLL